MKTDNLQTKKKKKYLEQLTMPILSNTLSDQHPARILKYNKNETAGTVSHNSGWLARCEEDKGDGFQECQGVLDMLGLIQYADFTVV